MSLSPLRTPDTEPLSERIARELKELIGRLRSTARRVRSREDGEAIHDLRIAVRRLEAWLDVWQEALPPRRVGRTRRSLHALRRAVGPTRSREAERERLEQLLEGQPETVRTAAGPLLEALERRIRRGRSRAARRVSKPRLRRLRARLGRIATGIPADAPRTILQNARRQCEELRLSALRGISEAHGGDDESLHAARIAIRRWRYALERIDPGASASALRDIQHATGETLELGAVAKRLDRTMARAVEEGQPEVAAALQPLRAQVDERRAARMQEWVTRAGRLGQPSPPIRAVSRPRGT
jgi:CHAD domain-containing protein